MSQKTLDDFESIGVESEKEPCPECGETFKNVAAHHWQAHNEKLRKRVECDHCGSEIERKPSEVYEKNYCDSDCMYAGQTGEGHPHGGSTIEPCSYCGDGCKRLNHKGGELGPFCDHECYGLWLSENRAGANHSLWTREVVECANCGSDKQAPAHLLEQNEKHFCDMGCKIEFAQKNSHATNLITAVRRRLSENTWTTVARNYRESSQRDCEMCGREPKERQNDVHHIVPIASGGWNGDENLMSACRSCHEKMERFVMQYPEFKPVLVE